MKLAWHYDHEKKVWWAYSRKYIRIAQGVWTKRWWIFGIDNLFSYSTLNAAKRAAEREIEKWKEALGESY